MATRSCTSKEYPKQRMDWLIIHSKKNNSHLLIHSFHIKHLNKIKKIKMADASKINKIHLKQIGLSHSVVAVLNTM